MAFAALRVAAVRKAAAGLVGAGGRGPVRHASSTSSRSAGLVGMPNVGKSTLFNALVRAEAAQASNFPFCTIEPNVSLAGVRDPNLDALAKFTGSQRTIGWQLEVHDIAGLIAGASKGEGLGNAFLSNIRETDAICQVVRCFGGSDVIHVLEHADPTRDIRIIEGELVLADAQSVEKRLPGARKAAGKSPEAAAQYKFLAALQPVLEAGLPARVLAHTVDPKEQAYWDRLQLLTTKPQSYVLNVAEEDLTNGSGGENDMTRAVRDFVQQRAAEQAREAGAPPTAAALAYDVRVVCAKVEAELALLPDEAERAEFLSAYGLSRSGLDGLIDGIAALLKLGCYYTTGPQESRAWPIPLGATAPQAAGVIHSEMQAGFIKAETIGLPELLKAGSAAKAREAGAVRSEGKEYAMRPGDVVLEFKFAAPRK